MHPPTADTYVVQGAAEYGSLRVFLRLVQVSAPMRLQLLLDAAKDLAATHDQGLYHGDVSVATIGVSDAVGGGYIASLSTRQSIKINDTTNLADAQADDVRHFGSSLIEAYRGVVDATKDLSDRRPDTMPVDLWTLANELSHASPSERRTMTDVVIALDGMVPVTRAPAPVRVDEAPVKTATRDRDAAKMQRYKTYALIFVGSVVGLTAFLVSVLLIPKLLETTKNLAESRSYRVTTFVVDNFEDFRDGGDMGLAGDKTFIYIGNYNNILRLNRSASRADVFVGDDSSNRATGFVNGVGTSARFYNIYALALSSDGALYAGDYYNYAVREIDSNGVVSTLAGTGVSGIADGNAKTATFRSPIGLAVLNGEVFVADANSHKVRSIRAGAVSTFSGSGVLGQVSGSSPTYGYPIAVAVAPSGLVYVTDGHRVRKIALDGNVTDIGNGTAGHNDGNGASAKFDTPAGLAVDTDGVVYVADRGNHCIRAIDTNDNVFTIAGTPGRAGTTDGSGSRATFDNPRDIFVDASGIVFVLDLKPTGIRRISYTNV